MELKLALVAFFYAMVGHGGASAYLAVGRLADQPMDSMRAMALWMNLGVASLALLAFTRARGLRWRLLLPLCVASAPAAFFTARLGLGSAWADGLIAFALLCSALRLLYGARLAGLYAPGPEKIPSATLLFIVGLGLGCLSGLTGVGGGIYLSPLLLLLGWADMKQTAALSAAFIVVNSLAGLVGLLSKGALPGLPLGWLLATLAGGALGAGLGANWIPQRRLAQVLASLLLLAALKLGTQALG